MNTEYFATGVTIPTGFNNGMKKEPDDNVLEACFHLAVKHSKALEHKLALYDRAVGGSQERTCEVLMLRGQNIDFLPDYNRPWLNW